MTLADTHPTLSAALAPGSQYATAHRSAPDMPIGKALRSLPEWTATRDQLATLPTYRRTVPVGQAEAVVDQLVLDALASGAALDDANLTAHAARAHAEAQGALLVAQAVHRIREQLTNSLDDALTAGRDRILAHLNGQLQGVLSEARNVLDRLGGIRDAEQAIDGGMLDVLRTWRRLVALHGQVRNAQRIIVGSSDSLGRPFRDRVLAHVAEPAAGDGDYYARLIGCRVIDGDDTRPPLPASWADDWTSEAGLEWCAQHPNARPWVPTTAELDAAELRIEGHRVRLTRELGRMPLTRRALTPGATLDGSEQVRPHVDSHMVVGR